MPHAASRRKKELERSAYAEARTKPLSGYKSFAESFLFAGTSALLLLLSICYQQFWYLSVLALAPFLYGISKSGIRESIRLSFLFGLSFLLVSQSNNLYLDTWGSILKITCGTALFTLFGWFISKARRSFGFNPVVTALIWVGFELAAIELGLFKGFFVEVEFSSPFLNGLAFLFGFIVISFLIVLINSLLVTALNKVISLTDAQASPSGDCGLPRILPLTPGHPIQKYSLNPDVRGPPVQSEQVVINH